MWRRPGCTRARRSRWRDAPLSRCTRRPRSRAAPASADIRPQVGRAHVRALHERQHGRLQVMRIVPARRVVGVAHTAGHTRNSSPGRPRITTPRPSRNVAPPSLFRMWADSWHSNAPHGGRRWGPYPRLVLMTLKLYIPKRRSATLDNASAANRLPAREVRHASTGSSAR